MAEHNKTGKIGEKTVENYLKQQNFQILSLNYSKKWGELDIVAQKRKKIYFIEVKTQGFPKREEGARIRPIERVDGRKLKRLSRAIQTYITENKLDLTSVDWQCDIYVVYLDQEREEAELEVLEDVVIE